MGQAGLARRTLTTNIITVHIKRKIREYEQLLPVLSKSSYWRVWEFMRTCKNRKSSEMVGVKERANYEFSYPGSD